MYCRVSWETAGSELTLWGLYEIMDVSSTLPLRVGASDLEVCHALGTAVLSGLKENLVRFGTCQGMVGEVFRVLVYTCV